LVDIDVEWPQDDILVYASNDDELKQRTERLLQRLNKRNHQMSLLIGRSQ